MILVAPCILLAPLAAVLALLALPLWPVAIIALAVARLIFWPVERILTATGSRRASVWSARFAAWFRIALKPWRYLDPPKPPQRVGAPRDSEANPELTGTEE